MGKLKLVQGFAGIWTDAAPPPSSAVSVLSRVFLAFCEIYKICTPSHLWNPKWKTTWRKTSRKIPKKTKELDPMENSKMKKLQGKHGTRKKRCGIRRQRDGQRRKTFSCIFMHFHAFSCIFMYVQSGACKF